ncbi:MAG: hypothetical protein KAH32_02695 [Chlamydiia bacterium]|nr:hypothetical protein [Chlamydiia bacterium]
MKKIKLAVGDVYIYGGKKYLGDKTYTVADALGKKLLASMDGRDVPYFTESSDEGIDPTEPNESESETELESLDDVDLDPEDEVEV